MQIATSKTREKFPLSEKKIIKKTIKSTLFWAITPLVILVFIAAPFLAASAALNQGAILYWLGPAALVFLALLAIICLPIYFYQRWYYAVYFYDLTPDFVKIRKGPITPREINIPYERIQDVYVDQDLLDRIFGLYDVHLSSATASSGQVAHIDGVEKAAADGLRELLLQTVKEKINKHKPASHTP